MAKFTDFTDRSPLVMDRFVEPFKAFISRSTIVPNLIEESWTLLSVQSDGPLSVKTFYSNRVGTKFVAQTIESEKTEWNTGNSMDLLDLSFSRISCLEIDRTIQFEIYENNGERFVIYES